MMNKSLVAANSPGRREVGQCSSSWVGNVLLVVWILLDPFSIVSYVD